MDFSGLAIEIRPKLSIFFDNFAQLTDTSGDGGESPIRLFNALRVSKVA